MSKTTFEVIISEISEQEVVNELVDFIKEKIPEKTKVVREGNSILIHTDDELVSKRYIKKLVRKYIGRANIGGINRVIADGPSTYSIIHREFEVE